ncbi:MAG: long-chain fatty acid--CoA ligase [Candidatus Heimdallarchaeota archaeon]
MEEYIWHKHKWPETVKKTLDYPNEPLFKILENTAAKSPELAFTKFHVKGGKTTTYLEINELSDKVANFLASKGIKKGDKVALFLPNTPHYPAVFFGILKAGATAVTCNPSYTQDELSYQLKDSEAVMVFCLDHENFTPKTYEAIKGTKVNHVVVCSVKEFQSKLIGFIGGLTGQIPKSPFYEEDKTIFFKDIVSSYAPKKPNVTINPKEDLAMLIYTGGTTGVPKGVMITHHNMYSNVLQINEWVQLVPDDGGPPEPFRYAKEVFIGALPWYHSYGLTLTLVTGALIGATIIPIPDPRAGDPPLTVVLEAIDKYNGTVLHAVPTIYSAIVNHPKVDEYDLTTLRGAGSGAAPLAPELAKEWERVTGGVIFEGYGLSETSPAAVISPTNKKTRKFGAIGFPISDTVIKIVDLETGRKELPHGEDGEVAIAGPQVMKGYWKRLDATNEVMRELDGLRFFLSGDIGHLDEEGYLVITDRKKDMINVSGLKAYPREIEDIFYEHPKVQLAAVIGLPREDDPTNEYVAAYLVLKEGEEATEAEILEWCKDKMAGYKRPRTVEFRESLPTSLVGKVLRRVIKEEVLE